MRLYYIILYNFSIMPRKLSDPNAVIHCTSDHYLPSLWIGWMHTSRYCIFPNKWAHPCPGHFQNNQKRSLTETLTYLVLAVVYLKKPCSLTFRCPGHFENNQKRSLTERSLIREDAAMIFSRSFPWNPLFNYYSMSRPFWNENIKVLRCSLVQQVTL